MTSLAKVDTGHELAMRYFLVNPIAQECTSCIEEVMRKHGCPTLEQLTTRTSNVSIVH